MLAVIASRAIAATSPQTGQYGGSLLLFVHDDVVRGVFNEERGGVGGVPHFDCTFLLRGTLRDGEAEIVTWYPGDTIEAPIKGHLSIGGDNARIQLAEEPGGCAMTLGDMVHEPLDIPQFTAEPGWIGVDLVAARRAPLRALPGAAAPPRPYLVAGDAVATLERRGDWVHVRYNQTETPVSGWLRASELASDAPPR